MWECETFIIIFFSKKKIRNVLGLHVGKALKKNSKIWLCEITFMLHISYSCFVLIRELNW